MVVLEGTTMLTVGNNQYLQPDYLSPAPSVIDSKKSPLALLAQTCSQIGADSSSVKPIVLDKSNNNNNSNKQKSEHTRSPSANNMNNNNTIKLNEKPNNGSPEIRLAFKPYEANVLTKKSDNEPRPSSKSSASGSEQDNVKNLSTKNNNHSRDRVPSRSSSGSPLNNNTSVKNNNNNNNHLVDVVENGKSTPGNNSDRKSGSPNDKGASPIIRSGMEVLHGSPKDYGAYKPGAFGINPLTGMPYSPGLDPTTNPAFRSPYAGFSHHHAAMLAAAASYSNSGATPTPFMSYARVKTPSGGEALVPVCKDPYCTGCQYSAHNQQMLMGTPCPQGCTQCEHQKIGLAMAMSSLPPGHPYASAMGRGYVCSWIMGGSYCGKRFDTSDELFAHLRTHTPNLSDPATAAATLAAQQNAALLNPLSSLYRAYSNPQLSPLSAARYHPYAKPGTLPPSLAAAAATSPYSAFNPAALGPYAAAYSPYAAAALYGQRMGAAHP